FILFGALPLFAGCGETKTVTDSQVADYNKPAIVYIVTTWSADVRIPTLDINLDSLITWTTGEVLAKRVANNESAILAATLNELIARPSLYFIASSETFTEPMESSISGNGFLINPEGNIITAAHMVKATESDLEFDMAKEAASTAIVDELDAFESDLSDLVGQDVTLTQEDADSFMLAVASIYAENITVSDSKQKTQVYTGNMIDKAREGDSGITAETVKVGDPIDMDEETGKDIAILKISGSNLPSVQLGDESSVREGDKVFGLGYLSQKSSESGEGDGLASKEDKPTLVSGNVAGHRKMDGGWEVLQMQIPLEEGSSGSPILNSNGDAIGSMTFVNVNTDSESGVDTSIATEKFAIPISVVKDYMSQVNVSASAGTATKAYREGVDLFSQQHYSAAKKKFEEVKSSNADYPFIGDYIAECQSNIDKGLDKGTFPWLVVIIVIAGAAVVGILLVVFLVILPGSKKKKQASVQGGPAAPPALGPPAGDSSLPPGSDGPAAGDSGPSTGGTGPSTGDGKEPPAGGSAPAA
ncbi:MAG: serine protease, partial [Thermoleophilia bacterium]|nr:serine protease [Thermoleophilia bacterium]